MLFTHFGTELIRYDSENTIIYSMSDYGELVALTEGYISIMVSGQCEELDVNVHVLTFK